MPMLGVGEFVGGVVTVELGFVGGTPLGFVEGTGDVEEEDGRVAAEGEADDKYLASGELSIAPKKSGSVIMMEGRRLSDQVSIVYSGSADLRTLKATAVGASTLAGVAVLCSSSATC